MRLSAHKVIGVFILQNDIIQDPGFKKGNITRLVGLTCSTEFW